MVPLPSSASRPWDSLVAITIKKTLPTGGGGDTHPMGGVEVPVAV